MSNHCRLYEVRIYVPVNGNGKLRLERTIPSKRLVRKLWIQFDTRENRRKYFVGLPPRTLRAAERQSIAERKAALVEHRRMEAVLDELIYTRGTY